MTATSTPKAAAASRGTRPRGFWAGVRSACLPLALFVMALPSLTGQTTSGPALRTRASGEPWITWDTLWMLPAGYLVGAGLVLALGWWRSRR